MPEWRCSWLLVVVVHEEHLAERSGVFDAAEALGELRAVLERLELGLAERVVIAHMRAAVGAADAEEGEQLDHGVRGHRAAPVGVDGELAGRYLMAGDGVGDEFFGELARLRGRHTRPRRSG